MGKIRVEYSPFAESRPAAREVASQEHVAALYPVSYYDDFLGAKLEKSITGENTTAHWAVAETVSSVALVANEPNGVVTVPISSADSAQLAVLYYGDQLPLKPANGLVIEFVAKLAVLPVLGTEAAEFVLGVASAHNATLNSVATHAWFYWNTTGLGLTYWETDDNTTDDDDNSTGVTLTNAAFHTFTIDFTTLAAVKFKMDGVLVGTASMAAATSAVVQPYIRAGKSKSSANTSVGTLYVDSVRYWQNRS